VVTVLVLEPVISSRHYKQDVCRSRAGEQLGAPFAFNPSVFPQLFFCIAKQIISNNPAVTRFCVRKPLKKIKTLGLSKKFHSDSYPGNVALDLQNETSSGSLEKSPWFVHHVQIETFL